MVVGGVVLVRAVVLVVSVALVLAVLGAGSNLSVVGGVQVVVIIGFVA